MKRYWILIAFAILFGLIYKSTKTPVAPGRLTDKTPEKKFGETEKEPLNAAEIPAATPPPSAKASLPVTQKKSAIFILRQKPAIEKQIPKLESVRQEVEANPHVMPQSLKKFSVELSEKMDLALQSQEASRYLMTELSLCAQGKKVETTSSTSAVCIKNAYELSDKYPELKSDADQIKSAANPQAQQIFESMQKLGI